MRTQRNSCDYVRNRIPEVIDDTYFNEWPHKLKRSLRRVGRLNEEREARRNAGRISDIERATCRGL